MVQLFSAVNTFLCFLVEIFFGLNTPRCSVGALTGVPSARDCDLPHGENTCVEKLHSRVTSVLMHQQ